MQRTVPIAILLFVGSILFAPNPVLADTKAVFGFPVLGVNQLAADLYLYSCTDATCASVTQLADYGHITQVQSWPKSVGGPGGAAPQTWVFLTIPDQGMQYYQFWQKNPDDKACWQSCIVGINAQGGLDVPPNTGCLGTVLVAQQHTTDVPYYNFGAAMFPPSNCGTPPANRSDINTLPGRSITFVNDTSAKTVCLNTKSNFNDSQCAGDGDHAVTAQSPYVISASDLMGGYNSGAAQVSGVMIGKDNWKYSGRDSSGNVYATKLEWTVWPQYSKSTMGPTTIDVSLVDGFNVGATLKADRDCACSIADTEGGTPYFVKYKAGDTLAVFPKPDSNSFSNICPRDNEVPFSDGAINGCYSTCTKAQVSSKDSDYINQRCCNPPYHSAKDCTVPPHTDYVKQTNSHSTRVYTWAYNDWRGTFTCEPTASFTFTITDIDEAM